MDVREVRMQKDRRAPQVTNALDHTAKITHTATIAALYAGLTLVCILFLGNLAWGPIQFRLSEAVCVFALFTPDAIAGLTLGCAVANIANIALSGTGMLGMLDVIFGSLATLVGAALTWTWRNKPALAVAGPVIANALIVPAYLPLILSGLGFYTIPFTSIALDGSYPLMYLFGFVSTGIGEATVMYALGLPLYHALVRTPLAKKLAIQHQTTSSSRV
jgi:uncharacterized membrane protein